MLVLILMTLQSFAQDIEVLRPENFCQLMLTPGAAQTQRLSETVLAQIGEQINSNKLRGQFSYMQDMREVMAGLVKAGTIDQAQADMLFAERILGGFDRVFLKYTFAELMGRGFTPEDIVQFVLHFEDAYNPTKQVEFAIDVSRRMLLTINEETGIQSAQGLKSFLAYAKAFGIPADTYSNFLQLWVHIRAAHPSMIVLFTLSNIKNAGHALRAQIDQASAPAPASTKPRWLSFFTPEFPRSADTITQELLSLDTIPEAILHPEAAFQPNQNTYQHFFDLYRAKTDSELKIYLDDLEQRPPFAREYIVYRQLPALTYARLKQFTQTPFYQKLSAETRKLGDELLGDFDKLANFETRLSAWPKVGTRIERESIRHPEAVAEFDQSMQAQLKGLRAPRLQRDVHDKILLVYDSIRKRFSGLSSEDCLSISSKVLHYNFEDRQLEQGLGAVRALVKIAHDFDLRQPQLDEIRQILESQAIVRKGNPSYIWTSTKEINEFVEYLHTDRVWRGTSTPANPPQLSALLSETRSLLEHRGMKFDDLNDVHALLLSKPATEKKVSFLPSGYPKYLPPLVR